MITKIRPCGIILVGLAWLSGAVFAQTNISTTTIPPAPLPGLFNDWLREQSTDLKTWDIGGQVRARYEDKAYFAVPKPLKAVDFQHTGDSGNAYELMRERLHLGWLPCKWFEIYGEMQDSTSFNDARQPSPDNDHYTLRQAWGAFGNPGEFPLMAKVGRQELVYGDQRLIGVADWLNFGRTYMHGRSRSGPCWSWPRPRRAARSSWSPVAWRSATATSSRLRSPKSTGSPVSGCRSTSGPRGSPCLRLPRQLAGPSRASTF